MGGGCYLTIRLFQPSLAGVRAGAELGNCSKLVRKLYPRAPVVCLVLVPYHCLNLENQVM